MKIKTYLCMISMNRWYQAEEVVRNLYPFVDHVVFIDGGSKDDTLLGLENICNEYGDNRLACTWGDFDNLKIDNEKVVIIHSKWSDDFPAQRQKYLDTIASIREEDEISWVIVSDSDEYFSPRLCKGIRNLCKWATSKDIECLGIRCKGITYDENKEITHLTYDEFWKPLVYRYDSDRRIIGVSPDGSSHNVHEGFSKPFTNIYNLPSRHEEGEDRELLYEHRKDPGDVWQRGHARNFYVGGGGPNLGLLQPLWKPFKELVKQSMELDGWKSPETWWDYDSYLKKGKIHYNVKSWFIQHMFEGQWDNRPEKIIVSINDDLEQVFVFNKSEAENKLGLKYDGSSEVREGYKYYFRFLHPEEEPEELKEYHIG